ncbi:MAG: WbqC family protein [Massilibacteroides sp.]|nr:WbqC family protein [Massilibacteroides sp.]MDD4115634.1 WbqC family protein [Massilibacteroides sp.]MDD4659666.1 WbqC family protein [Massilibacteroides sp.]
MGTVFLSTTYLGPIQYYCKLLQFPNVEIEREENFVKQTYRNRCVIAAANGPLILSVPTEKPETIKCRTKDIRISDHGNWRHLHWNALVSAYSTSPFFIYYQDDFAPFFEKKFTFLFDFNEELRKLICSLLDMEPTVSYTKRYNAEVLHDFREKISPKSPVKDLDFVPVSYYQVFREKYGFLSNLSIVDLLFNMGPEGLLVLQQSIRK